ncbi:hypothetical protein BpHYR1_019414 [Brachionus plicatilis]|uniref:Uncharacterized protein n=1 Tax=Brachionus plicatilis TaxID=10195 RepID=A0A3M7RDH2_BRAPC|nr:hypothetical protein BpHYR1_019414 [Brachionus plicatilis]
MIEEAMANPGESPVEWSPETESQVTEAKDDQNSTAQSDHDSSWMDLKLNENKNQLCFNNSARNNRYCRGTSLTQAHNAPCYWQRSGRVDLREWRPTPLLFLTMRKVQENRWLLQMIRSTPFDGQLMVSGQENYISCWVPIDDMHEPTGRNRSGESTPTEVTNRETEMATESADASVSTPGREIAVYPDSQIRVRLDTLLGAVMGRGRGLGFRATLARAQGSRGPENRITEVTNKPDN